VARVAVPPALGMAGRTAQAMVRLALELRTRPLLSEAATMSCAPWWRCVTDGTSSWATWGCSSACSGCGGTWASLPSPITAPSGWGWRRARSSSAPGWSGGCTRRRRCDEPCAMGEWATRRRAWWRPMPMTPRWARHAHAFGSTEAVARALPRSFALALAGKLLGPGSPLAAARGDLPGVPRIASGGEIGRRAGPRAALAGEHCEVDGIDSPCGKTLEPGAAPPQRGEEPCVQCMQVVSVIPSNLYV
jgi:hypothetical protein